MISNNSARSGSGRIVGRKSWVAYFKEVIPALSAALISVAMLLCLEKRPLVPAALAVIAAIFAYRVLVIRSYRITVDRDGVWIFSGVLPWTKGYSGVKWHDLDEAVFFQSLLGWLTKSCTVRITHRFTKDNEICMTHTARGDDVVATINAVHVEMLKMDNGQRDKP